MQTIAGRYSSWRRRCQELVASSDGGINIEALANAANVEYTTRPASPELHGMRRIAFVVFWLTLLGSIGAMSQESVSLRAGGMDLNLPQPESKADALSPALQLSAKDSEALVVLGLVTTVLAGISAWFTLRRLRRNEAPVLAQWPLSITVACFLTLIGLVALWYIFPQ